MPLSKMIVYSIVNFYIIYILSNPLHIITNWIFDWEIKKKSEQIYIQILQHIKDFMSGILQIYMIYNHSYHCLYQDTLFILEYLAILNEYTFLIHLW